MNANPVGLVVAGIAALVAGIALAWQHSETFRGVLLGTWEVLTTVWDTVSGFATQLWNFLPPVVMIRAQIEALSMLFSYLWPMAKDIFSKIGSFISDVFGGAIDWVVEKVQALFGWLSNLAASLGITNVVEKLTGAFGVGFAKGKGTAQTTDETDEGGAMAALTGKTVTMTALADDAKKGSKGKHNKGLDSVSGDSKVAKNMTINIEKLIESLNVSSTTMQGSTEDVRRQVAETLINAVRDFEVSYS